MTIKLGVSIPKEVVDVLVEGERANTELHQLQLVGTIAQPSELSEVLQKLSKGMDTQAMLGRMLFAKLGEELVKRPNTNSSIELVLVAK